MCIFVLHSTHIISTYLIFSNEPRARFKVPNRDYATLSNLAWESDVVFVTLPGVRKYNYRRTASAAFLCGCAGNKSMFETNQCLGVVIIP